MSNWLSADDWKRVQDAVPICCADVLPLKLAPGGAVEKVGLIFRDTPHQGRRWCLVGGRMRRNESLAEAAGRQIVETLGEAVRFDLPGDLQPVYVAQYFTFRREPHPLDPRQHAVTMNFCVPLEGEIRPRGEAAAFEWYTPSRLPPAEQFGFEQDRVVRACMDRGWGRDK